MTLARASFQYGQAVTVFLGTAWLFGGLDHLGSMGIGVALISFGMALICVALRPLRRMALMLAEYLLHYVVASLSASEKRSDRA